MARRTRGALVVAGALVLALGWYLFRPERAFLDQVVDEPLPGGEPAAGTRPQAVPHDSASAIGGAPAGAGKVQGEPAILASGTFRPVAHAGEGRATIHELEDGRRILRLTAFRTDNGPDLFVVLVAASDAPDDETVERAGYVSLGPLRGNVGDQNYEVPAELDLSLYRAVSIWCRRFGVNFAAAALAPS